MNNLASRTIERTLLFAIFTTVPLLAIKPWIHFFSVGLAEHWDSKLMGQWMAWNASNILDGQWLLPNFHANFFYPHSYALAFSELLWPQSFIYAAIYHFSGGNPFLSFNGTMLVFWGISGLAMFAFLRELSFCKAVSFLGGIFYCLIPYHLAYHIEFNMTLMFIIPLFLLAIQRYFKDVSIKNSVLIVVCFIISVTSCVYYTIIVTIPAIFLITAWISSKRKNLWNKNFFALSSQSIFLIIIFSSMFLWPYPVLFSKEGYQRTSTDHAKHHAQPQHYIDVRRSKLSENVINAPRSRTVETILFPGMILTPLFLAGLIQIILKIRENYRGKKQIFFYLLACLWVCFWIIILINNSISNKEKLNALNVFLYPIGILLMTMHVLSIFTLKNESSNKIMLLSLCCGATFCFFISLGAHITTGAGNQFALISKGPAITLLDLLPIFKIVRGLSRFSIIPLFGVIVVVCYALNSIRRQQPMTIVACVGILPLLMIYEGQFLRYNFTDYEKLYHSPVATILRKKQDPYTLLQLPAGPREVDANAVMQTIGRHQFLINGHSGFAPLRHNNLYGLLRKWKIGEASAQLKEIWPPVDLLIDKKKVLEFSTGWHQPFPLDELYQGWKLVAEDENYSLFEQRENPSYSKNINRIVRSDVLKHNNLLSFAARTVSTTKMSETIQCNVTINGSFVEMVQIDNSWDYYQVRLPDDFEENIAGEIVSIELMDESSSFASSGLEVRNIYFKPVSNEF